MSKEKKVMENEKTDSGRNADGERDKRKQFQETWEGLNEDERFERAYGLQQSESGASRKVQELLSKNQHLESKNDDGKMTEQAQLLLEAKAKLDVQTRLIERAAAGEIPADIAIQFANTPDPDGLFDRLEQVISERVDAEVNTRIGSKTPEGYYPHKDYVPNVGKMTIQEISRLPDHIRDRLMGMES